MLWGVIDNIVLPPVREQSPPPRPRTRPRPRPRPHHCQMQKITYSTLPVKLIPAR